MATHGGDNSRQYVLDHAQYRAPSRQHMQDHIDHEYICPERSTVDHVAGIKYLSGLWKRVYTEQEQTACLTNDSFCLRAKRTSVFVPLVYERAAASPREG